MADKLSVAEFAQTIKAKYPDYANIPDDALVRKIVAKYPDYQAHVDVPAFDVTKQNAIMQANMAKQPPGTGESSTLADFARSGAMGDVLTGLNKGHEGNYAGAAHGIASGVGQVLTPAALPAIAAAGIPAALGTLATGAIGQGALRGAAGMVTDNPDYIDVAGDVGGLVGGLAGPRVGNAAAAVAKPALRIVGKGVGGAVGALDPDLVGMVSPRAGNVLRKAQGIQSALEARAAKAGVPTGTAAANAAEIAADLTSGRPIKAADFVAKLQQLSPEQQAEVMAARQAAVKGQPAPEAPLAMTKRLNAEHRAQYAGPETPVMREVTGPQLGPEAAPAAAAPHTVAPAAEPPPPSALAKPVPDAPPAKLLDPDYAKSPQRMINELGVQAKRLGAKLSEDQLKAGVEAVQQGGRPDLVAKRLVDAAPVDPAAELARRLGTPSPEEVAAKVEARNRTGQWERPKATLKAKRAGTRNYGELIH